MKITKSQLLQIIREEIINEIGVPISQIGGGTVVADPHTAAIDSLEDYIANHYPSDDALRELVENVQDLVADFEDDIQDKLADPLNEATALNEFGGAGLNSLIKEVADNGLDMWGGERSTKAVKAARAIAKELVPKANPGDFDRLEEIADTIASRLQNLFN